MTQKRKPRRPFWEASKEECTYCGERLLPMEIEHVRPRSRGGDDDQTVIACVSCNRQKGTMLVHEWRAWRERNGMPWPPIASHATWRQPEHYRDATGCDVCKQTKIRRAILEPESMWIHGTGYAASYLCPIHKSRYKVGWGVSPHWFGDCPCSFCVAMRLEISA